MDPFFSTTSLFLDGEPPCRMDEMIECLMSSNVVGSLSLLLFLVIMCASCIDIITIKLYKWS